MVKPDMVAHNFSVNRNPWKINTMRVKTLVGLAYFTPTPLLQNVQ